MAAAEEPARRDGPRRLPHQQSRPQGGEGESLQELYHPLRQGTGQAGARPGRQGDHHGSPQHQVDGLQTGARHRPPANKGSQTSLPSLKLPEYEHFIVFN